MEFFANEGKNVEIEVNGKTYLRHAIKTRFVKQGESYIDVFKEYVAPIYQEGDIVSSSEKIIASITQLSTELGFEVIAEYVETEDQKDMLVKLGCNLYQGWLFSPAVPLNQLKEHSVIDFK